MTTEKPKVAASTRRVMAALVRMQPKPHEDMKLGKTPHKPSGKPKRAATTRKPLRVKA